MSNLKWLFDPSPISGNEQGESPFSAMLEGLLKNLGTISMFVRGGFNSADQRSKRHLIQSTFLSILLKFRSY